MTRLSAAALDLLRREGSKHPDVRARQRDILRDAESQPAAERWRRLDDVERRSLLAYLVDDAQEYPEHYPANVAAIGMLLTALDSAEAASHQREPSYPKSAKRPTLRAIGWPVFAGNLGRESVARELQ